MMILGRLAVRSLKSGADSRLLITGGLEVGETVGVSVAATESFRIEWFGIEPKLLTDSICILFKTSPPSLPDTDVLTPQAGDWQRLKTIGSTSTIGRDERWSIFLFAFGFSTSFDIALRFTILDSFSNPLEVSSVASV